jgi:glycosyltransferase involved in cell wall biosynthesis
MPSFEHFKALAAAAGIDEARCVGLDPRTPKHNMGEIDVVFRPDPLINFLTWRRQQIPAPGYATCGLVHTMSGNRIAEVVGDLVAAPSNASDALICPSEAIREVVQNLWQIHIEYLNHRGRGQFTCPVQTPVIPLGIDTGRFAKLTTTDKRAAQRKALNAADDEIIILFLGRLSFATKAHPLALWQAAERAAARTNKKLRVVMFGYFKPRDMEAHFRSLATEIGKKASIEFIMNDDARFPDGLWAGADIFTSLSDNIQESFGLTPVESMACGLPAIITDWNGYRGSIRDGQEGFLIPTVTPPIPAGMAIAEAYYNDENYGVSLMGAAQSTAIDIDRCADAIVKLADDAALRRRFSDSGRKRAADIFDWKHIIKAYETLWQDLATKRKTIKADPLPPNWQAVHPSYPNPYQMFRSFPTHILAPADQVQIVMDKAEVTAIIAHEMNYFLPQLLAPKETMLDLIELIRKAGKLSVRNITGSFPTEQHNTLLRCIGWMLKHGVATMERAA